MKEGTLLLLPVGFLQSWLNLRSPSSRDGQSLFMILQGNCHNWACQWWIFHLIDTATVKLPVYSCFWFFRLAKFWNQSLLHLDYVSGRSLIIETLAVHCGQEEENNNREPSMENCLRRSVTIRNIQQLFGLALCLLMVNLCALFAQLLCSPINLS